MNKITIKYGFFLLPYYLFKRKIEKIRFMSIAKNANCLNSLLFVPKFDDCGKHIFDLDACKGEIDYILSGSRQILFFDDDFELNDIKRKWENDRKHHLVILSFFANDNPTIMDYYRKEISNLSTNFLNTNAMEVAISIINVAFSYQNIKYRTNNLDVTVGNFLKEGLIFVCQNLEEPLRYYSNHLFFDLLGILWIFSCCEIGSVYHKKHRMIEKKMLNVLSSFLNKDGSLYEGSTFYHSYVTESLWLFEKITGCNNKKMIQVLDRMVGFLNYASFDGQLIGIGDNDSGRILPFPHYFKYSSYDFLLNSNLLKAGIGKSNNENKKNSFGLFKIYNDYWKIAIRCDYIPSKKKDRVVSVHYHNDQLSITTHGKYELLVDSGTYSYSLDNNTRLKNMITKAHNTITINDLEQNNIYNSWKSGRKKSKAVILYKTNSLVKAAFFGYKSAIVYRTIRLDGKNMIIEDEVRSHDIKCACCAYFNISSKTKVKFVESKHIRIEGCFCYFDFFADNNISLEQSYVSCEYGKKETSTRIRIDFKNSNKTRIAIIDK